MNAISADTYCSTYSREQTDPLMGTATRADVWLLLEYRGVFGRKAVEEAGLSISVQDHLDRALAAIPHARLQLVQRQGASEANEEIMFAVAVSDEIDPRLTVFPMAAVDELLQIDIRAVVQGDTRYAANQSKELLVLVCGNVNRDRCCGKRALGAAENLQKRLGDHLWLTSHVGGHRYAATGVILPHGIMFGRLDDADSDTFVESIEAGHIHLPSLRGRSLYDPPAQVADFFLRQETGLLTFDAFRLIGLDEVETDSWIATFAETGSGADHRLQIRRKDSDFAVISSCGDEQGQPADIYHMVGYERHEAATRS